jgi:nucleotide-binding universal stress UspA family protein
MTGTGLGVLVGYDGSPGSEQALLWATREAWLRDSIVTVCYAWASEYVPELPGDARARRQAERILAQGLRFARDVMGPGRVWPLLAADPAARVLCEHSVDADLVVVGAQGRLPSTLGSVGQQVCAYACGPVVVVRGHWHPAAEYAPGPVVVGADGSPASQAAMAFAAQEATLRAVTLQVVSALADAPGDIGGFDRMQAEIDHDVAYLEKHHPELTTLRQVSYGQPRTALVDAAAGAQLIVVGNRGSGLPDIPLDPAAQAIIQHAPCPVGVVQPD